MTGQSITCLVMASRNSSGADSVEHFNCDVEGVGFWAGIRDEVCWLRVFFSFRSFSCEIPNYWKLFLIFQFRTYLCVMSRWKPMILDKRIFKFNHDYLPYSILHIFNQLVNVFSCDLF